MVSFNEIVKLFFIISAAISIYAIANIDYNFINKRNKTEIFEKNNKETLQKPVGLEYQFTKSSKTNDLCKNFGDIENIVKRGELVVCAKQDTNNPLFQMKKKDGNIIGEDISLAKEIAENLGVKLIYRLIYKTYDDVVDAIEKGEGDIGIAKLSYTKERGRKVLFSSPYVISRKAMLINRIAIGKLASKSIADLFKDKTTNIAVTENTSYETYSKNIFPNTSVITHKDWEKYIIPKVESGEIIATMRDEVRIKLLLKKNQKLLLNIIPIILKGEEDSISAVVNFKNTALLSWVNKLLATGKGPSTVGGLMKKYEEYIK